MKTITPISLLATARPGTVARVTLQTVPTTTKKHRDTGERFADLYPLGLVKRQTILSRLNCDYQSCVNRMRTREDHPESFASLGLPAWVDADSAAATWPIYHHRDSSQAYIRLHHEATLITVYLDANGQPLTERQESLLAGVLPQPRAASSGRQETEGSVRPIGPKLESIVGVKCGGQTLAA